MDELRLKNTISELIEYAITVLAKKRWDVMLITKDLIVEKDEMFREDVRAFLDFVYKDTEARVGIIDKEFEVEMDPLRVILAHADQKVKKLTDRHKSLEDAWHPWTVLEIQA